MSNQKRNTQITQIFKLKDVSNYQPLSVVIKLLLRSKNWWKIVNVEKKEPEPSTNPSSSDPSSLASSSKKKVLSQQRKTKTILGLPSR